MACCGSSVCACLVVAGDNITVEGVGSPSNPYIVSGAGEPEPQRIVLVPPAPEVWDVVAGGYQAPLSTWTVLEQTGADLSVVGNNVVSAAGGNYVVSATIQALPNVTYNPVYEVGVALGSGGDPGNWVNNASFGVAEAQSLGIPTRFTVHSMGTQYVAPADSAAYLQMNSNTGGGPDPDAGSQITIGSAYTILIVSSV